MIMSTLLFLRVHTPYLQATTTQAGEMIPLLEERDVELGLPDSPHSVEKGTKKLRRYASYTLLLGTVGLFNYGLQQAMTALPSDETSIPITVSTIASAVTFAVIFPFSAPLQSWLTRFFFNLGTGKNKRAETGPWLNKWRAMYEHYEPNEALMIENSLKITQWMTTVWPQTSKDGPVADCIAFFCYQAMHQSTLIHWQDHLIKSMAQRLITPYLRAQSGDFNNLHDLKTEILREIKRIDPYFDEQANKNYQDMLNHWLVL